MLKIDCSGKRYLVTGGAGIGVGAGVCEAIVKSGGQVIINDLAKGKINKALEKYPNAVGVPYDVSVPSEVDDMFAFINKEYGVVHGLVNNAGIGLRKRAHNTTESEFDQLYNIDVKGVWLMARAFTNQLIANNEIGHLVNISSVHAHATTSKHAIYSSAKMAVEGLTRGMAVELGELGIRCNAVAPGYVDSEQNRKAVASWSDNPKKWEEKQRDEYQSLKHLVSPLDCGNAVVFLLSDLARSITGQTLIVDGGFTNLLYGNSFLDNKKKK